MSEDLEPSRGPTGPPPPAAVSGEVLDGSAEGLLWIEGGRIVQANLAAAQLAGAAAPELLLGRDVDALLADVGPTLPAGSAGPLACRLRRDDGVLREVGLCVLADGPGFGIWALRDAEAERASGTEAEPGSAPLLEAQRRVAELEATLEQDSASREELLAVVSHELRTPLTVINGFNRLLLSEQVGPLNPRQQQFLQESARSCRRLDAFVANLIEGARAGAREIELEPRETSLKSALEGVVGFFSPLLDERDLSIELALADDAAQACFDPLRLEQVFTNLIGNALRYSPPGGCIRVATRRLPAAIPPQVEVSVSDQGPGIAEAERERIFEPYVQGQREKASGGLGLGLAICRRIIEKHGGGIGVSPSREGGSRFTFTLPCHGETA